MEDIHDLFEKVRNHPDFAGGTIFTREDVAVALFEPEAGWSLDKDITGDMLARVTPKVLKEAERVIYNWIFDGSYDWAEALRNNVSIDPTPPARA